MHSKLMLRLNKYFSNWPLLFYEVLEPINNLENQSQIDPKIKPTPSRWCSDIFTMRLSICPGIMVLRKPNINNKAKIKTRTATSNQKFENSIGEKNNLSKKGRRNKFKSLIIEKNLANN